VSKLCRAIVWVLLAGVAWPAALESRSRADPYLETLKSRGQDPSSFVLARLEEHDLLVFDDGLHTLVEPFEFYQRLVNEPGFRRRATYIFLEVVPLNKQRHIEAYLEAPVDDSSLLFPAFQDNVGGDGLPYATYFELLGTVRKVNQSIPDNEKLRVVAVGSPSYWAEIETSRDLELFRLGLAGYDHTMYRTILATLEESGQRGILLTNTRHAYKGIRRKDGTLHWNAMTFFHQYHPGLAYSIRFHAPTLFLERMKTDSSGSRSTEGLDRVDYRWVRMANGDWDRAFQANGNQSIAVPLEGTPFGTTPYVGNHMLDAAPSQTMADAYDALIFLKPLEELHRTAIVGSLYTEEFREELTRRLMILYTAEQLDEMMTKDGFGDLGSFIEATYVDRPQEPLPQARGLATLEQRDDD
jgi:hypothetical protein